MNQKHLFLIITTLALLIIAGAFWFMQKRQVAIVEPSIPVPSRIESEKPLDTSDWKTYQNEEYGFEVRFPKEWSIDNERSSSNNVVFDTGYPESRESISFERNSKNISGDAWVQINRGKHEGVILSETELFVGKYSAKKIETGEMAQTYIVFSSNKFLYTITTMGLFEKKKVLETFKSL